MSFKTWSAAQDAPGKKQADDKATVAPAVAKPAAQPTELPEKSSVQGSPETKT